MAPTGCNPVTVESSASIEYEKHVDNSSLELVTQKTHVTKIKESIYDQGTRAFLRLFVIRQCLGEFFVNRLILSYFTK